MELELSKTQWNRIGKIRREENRTEQTRPDPIGTEDITFNNATIFVQVKTLKQYTQKFKTDSN